jgi:uroporphyrinogen decarboxylase
MNKREWLLKCLRNERVDAVPAGFWFHFVPDELADGFSDPRIFGQNMEGHKKFYREFQPDFLKIMTDGFFIYPNEEFRRAETAADLKGVKSLGEHHPWIEKQVAHAKTITDLFGREVMTFYNIFAPATVFKFVRHGACENPGRFLADLIAGDKAAVKAAFDAVAADFAVLAKRVIQEGGADGVYFSCQDINDGRVSAAVHKEVIAPSDIKILRAANAAGARGGPWNILHICGYAGHKNDLRHFIDYPAQIVNWAAVYEGIPLSEGKKLFGGRPVIGGFDNTTDGILYRGSEAEIKAETKRLLQEAGRTGVILGADCTIPRDTDLRRLQWVREAAAE